MRGRAEQGSSPGEAARPTHVGDDGQVRQSLQDIEPHADVLGALGHRPPVLAHKLVRIQADLGPIVEEGEERRQRERRHEDGDEAKLENCNKEKIDLTFLLSDGCLNAEGGAYPSPGTPQTGPHTPPAGSPAPTAKAHGMPCSPVPWTLFSSAARPSLCCHRDATKRKISHCSGTDRRKNLSKNPRQDNTMCLKDQTGRLVTNFPFFLLTCPSNRR